MNFLFPLVDVKTLWCDKVEALSKFSFLAEFLAAFLNTKNKSLAPQNLSELLARSSPEAPWKILSREKKRNSWLCSTKVLIETNEQKGELCRRKVKVMSSFVKLFDESCINNEEARTKLCSCLIRLAVFPTKSKARFTNVWTFVRCFQSFHAVLFELTKHKLSFVMKTSVLNTTSSSPHLSTQETLYPND